MGTVNYSQICGSHLAVYYSVGPMTHVCAPVSRSICKYGALFSVEKFVLGSGSKDRRTKYFARKFGNPAVFPNILWPETI